MFKQPNLAIIIPAYKVAYLHESLSSIANQTNQNFVLYIGDDNSPDDIEGVVNQYRLRINLVYKKFSENLGAQSLVKHWERCISLSANEKWIWLFSDDDVMGTNAVNDFLLTQRNTENIYRFNLNIIDSVGRFLKNIRYPQFESAASFIKSRLAHKYDNVITNYIFSRRSYNAHKGFVDFPLAWGSDDASIIQFAEGGLIELIGGAEISWRSSGKNITTDFTSEVLQRKVAARILFVNWLYNKKYNLIACDRENKRLVAGWFYNSMQAEFPRASLWNKLHLLRKISPSVRWSIGKFFLTELKKRVKSSIV